MPVNKNPLTNDMSLEAVSKGDSYFKRDWKPLEVISQDSVNEIPFIDISAKTIIQAIAVFLFFAFVVPLLTN